MSWFDEVARNRGLQFGAGLGAVAVAVVVGLVIGSTRNGGGVSDLTVGPGSTTTTSEVPTTVAFGLTTSTFVYDPTSTLPPDTTPSSEAPPATAVGPTTTARAASTTTARPAPTTNTTAAPGPTTTATPQSTTTTFPPGSSRVTMFNDYPRTIRIVINGSAFTLTAGERRGPVAVPSSSSAETSADRVEVSVPGDAQCGAGDGGSIFRPNSSYAVNIDPAEGTCGNGNPNVGLRITAV